MKEAIFEIITYYRELTGTSIIVPLTFLSLFVICLFNNYIYANDDKRRRINPTVFLLSIWIMISYTLTIVTGWLNDALQNEKSRENNSLIYFFKKAAAYISIIAICMMSGRFVFYKSYLENSVYSSGDVIKIIVSVILTVICIGLYIATANTLFNDKADKMAFLSYSLILNLFSVYSEKSMEYNLFLNPVSFGSIVIHLILPFILFILIWKYRELIILKDIYDKRGNEDDENTNEANEEYEEEWDMKKHKILNMRNMAIAFAVLVVAFIGVVFILNSKINSLYSATLVLEQAARDKASVFTYVSEENEAVSLQVIVAGDGNITVYGGGSYEDGVQFMEYLKQYGTTVDKWYLNSKDSSETGIYEYCRNNGIVVNSLYCINGIEKVE